jgi:hypothetical protein
MYVAPEDRNKRIISRAIPTNCVPLREVLELFDCDRRTFLANQELRTYLIECRARNKAFYYDADNFRAIQLELAKYYSLRQVLRRTGWSSNKLLKNKRLRKLFIESDFFGMKFYRKDKVEAFMTLHAG